jgi:hypothetical protein
MLKKVILSVLLSGLMGVLIWGGVNRTLAKTNNNDRNIDDPNLSSDILLNRNGVKMRSNGYLEFSDLECDQKKHQGNVNGQIDLSFDFSASRISENLTNTYEQINLRGCGSGSGNRNGQSGE